mgnify:CR=1 FL=1
MSWIEGAARQLYNEWRAQFIKTALTLKAVETWEELSEEQKVEWRAKANASSLLNILEETKDEPDADDDYPPVGTPERALILAIDADNFTVLAHTGRFFHAQIACAGYDGEEVGIERPADLEPGYYVYEGTKAWERKDWETGLIDDYGLGGALRPATHADFFTFGVKPPYATGVLEETIQKFIADNKIHAPETIYQTDRVIENATPFIEELVNLIGYLPSEEEEDD